MNSDGEADVRPDVSMLEQVLACGCTVDLAVDLWLDLNILAYILGEG